MPADRQPPTAGSSVGIWWGVGIGLALGIPAGVALKAEGYPTDELYRWWRVLGVAYVVILAVALGAARRARRLAGGIVIGATLGVAITPCLVIVDILVHSE